MHSQKANKQLRRFGLSRVFKLWLIDGLIKIPSCFKFHHIFVSITLWRDADDSFNPYNAEILLYIPWRPKGFFQFEIIINVLVGSYYFIWIAVLWVYGHYNFLILSARGSTSDVRIWRVMSLPELKGLFMILKAMEGGDLICSFVEVI